MRERIFDSASGGGHQVFETDYAKEMLGTLYRNHHRRVFAQCLMMVRDRQEAEELCHETFLRAMHGWNGFESRSQPLTWIIAVARNTCLNHLKRRAIQARCLETIGRDSVPCFAKPRDPEQMLLADHFFDRELARMNHSGRTVLHHYYRLGLNHCEIARETGLSRVTVSGILSRAEAFWAGEATSRRSRQPRRRRRMAMSPERPA